MGTPLLLLNVGLFAGTAALFAGLLWYVLRRLPLHPPGDDGRDGGRSVRLAPLGPGPRLPVRPAGDGDLARSA